MFVTHILYLQYKIFCILPPILILFDFAPFFTSLVFWYCPAVVFFSLTYFSNRPIYFLFLSRIVAAEHFDSKKKLF